jgi:hypothetical protein
MRLADVPIGLRQLVVTASVTLALGAGALTRSQGAGQAGIEPVTSPRDAWGHDIGDDYFLVNYEQLLQYWRTLAHESPRVRLVPIGRTAEGREQVMAIVTAPANFARLDRYRDISKRLARAAGLTDGAAEALAAEGKAVVWIDGGLHANEVLGAQQLVQLVYELASRSDDETRRILDDVILLAVPANPDGMDLVSDWYMRHGDTNVPVLYSRFAGHDNNRDFYMSALAETANLNRVLYADWYPQIVYNHHQTGPRGTVMFAPPFRDPFNYFFHPNVPAGIDAIGAAMAERFISEGKPGVTSRQGQNYSTWWNGGLRTTAYFHNMIGLLTETIGSPTPTSIPFVKERQIPDSNLWWPIDPQPAWHFRQSIAYEMTANRAVLDYASRNREPLLRRIYQMGRDEIRWGSEDHWTTTPHELEAASAAGAGGRPGDRAIDQALHAPDRRDPRGFIIPANQPDFGTATKFVRALVSAGVEVLRATAPFTVGGRSYPAGSFVVRTAQAFRPHVLDMFEPQDHPDDVPYPGGPPRPPYDNAGYTLAFQMGVTFDRVLDAFDGPFKPVGDDVRMEPGRVEGAPAAGYAFTHAANDSFAVVNRLFAAGERVSWLADGPFGPGTFYVESRPGTRSILERAAADLGLTFVAVDRRPVALTPLRTPRVAVFDQYGGTSPSGWTRLVLDEFGFQHADVFPPALASDDLLRRFDVIVFNDEGIPAPGGRAGAMAPASGGPGRGNAPPDPIPPEYLARQGLVGTAAIANLTRFLRAGGTIVATGRAAGHAARQFGVAVTNPVAGLARRDYYVPGSVLRVAIDPAQPLAAGLGDHLDVFFDDDPVFAIAADASPAPSRIGWFDTASALRSGWAWGASRLEGGAAIVSARIGRGRIVLAGPEILFRAQAHGAFKLLFNALLLSAAPASPGR